MSHTQFSLSSLLVAALLTAGCAGVPTGKPQAASESRDCAQVRADIAAAEEAKRAAQEKEQGAWKVVIPFAVAARYASAKSAVSEADKRLAQLDAEFTQRGCAKHDN